MQIEGSRVLLTGASGGLGRAIAEKLADRGAELVLTARNEEVLGELAERTGGEVAVADLASRADLERLCSRLGEVDVLVANAGLGGDGSITETSVESIDRVLDVNLRAPMVLAAEFARRRIEADTAGQVVMIGSLAGVVATANSAMYNGTKFGLRGFTLAIRQDLEPHGIGVTHIAPGFIDTAGMFAENGIELPGFVRTRSPGDVASAVAKAIESNPAELFVSPPELRATAAFGGLLPGISEVLQRRLGVADRSANR
ncbi:MAG: SDR family NAD(P)-dependent oxidoreductase [Microthrixaceae bacterium]